ncbi:hypothetical protein ACFQW6_17775 [Nocardioides sp. GCM10028917]|uniref:hypothetical protein n=1 Tax=Nocardioides sp. GCM10028917 TaxID=3273408 RepID=UPI00361F5587
MTTTPAKPRDAASGPRPADPSSTAPSSPWRTFGRWLVSFLGFPVGGYVAFLTIGPLESIPTALAGGALTGVVLGLAQAWAFGPTRPRSIIWVLSTAAGLAAGTALGAALTDYATDTTSLVVLGAVTGAFVGAAQGVLLIRHLRAVALAWPLVLSGTWALGWLVSEAVIGSSVDQHFYIFGSSGAIVVAVLTAPLALVLAGPGSTDRPSSAARPMGSAS